MNRLFSALSHSFLLTFFLALPLCLQHPQRCLADEVFPVVHDEPLTVQVLRGADGKPWARQHVVLMGGYDRHDLDVALWRVDLVTDDAGKVHLSNALKNLPWLRVKALSGLACAPDEAVSAFSVELIRRDGVAGPNQCGPAFAESATGMLTVYVQEDVPAKEKLRLLAVKARLKHKTRAETERELLAEAALPPPVGTVAGVPAAPPASTDAAHVQTNLSHAAQTPAAQVSAAQAQAELKMPELTPAEIDELNATQP